MVVIGFFFSYPLASIITTKNAVFLLKSNSGQKKSDPLPQGPGERKNSFSYLILCFPSRQRSPMVQRGIAPWHPHVQSRVMDANTYSADTASLPGIIFYLPRVGLQFSPYFCPVVLGVPFFTHKCTSVIVFQFHPFYPCVYDFGRDIHLYISAGTGTDGAGFQNRSVLRCTDVNGQH